MLGRRCPPSESVVVLHGDSYEMNLINLKPGAIAVISLSLLLVAGVCQADPGTPAQQYAARFRDYQTVSGGMRKAKTDRQRKAAVARK